MLETQRLEELPLPDNGIDEGIANLVRTVVLIGVPTNASCEGHLDSDHHCHPWVGIKFPESPAAQRLRSLVETYNETHGTQWEIKQPPKDPDWPLPPVFGELQPLTGKENFRCCLGEAWGLTVPGDIRGITSEELQKLQQSASELAQYLVTCESI